MGAGGASGNSAEGGATAADSPEGDGERGGGIGAWFRNLGGGKAEEGGGSGTTGTDTSSNTGAAGWTRGSWWGGGGDGRRAGGGERPGSPVETQVRALQEMGFPEVRRGACVVRDMVGVGGMW